MPPDAPGEIIQTMLGAAHAAGKGLRHDFAHRSGLDIIVKNASNDLCSAADLRAEETISRILRAAFPACGFLGEESGYSGDTGDFRWIVDPLDGTMNFLRGIPVFAVSIALARGQDIVAGVVHLPMTGEMFHAQKSAGAYLDGAPMRVSGCSALESAAVSIGIPFYGKPGHSAFHKEMHALSPQLGQIRRLGACAAEMAYVACGRLDAYWERAVQSWDIAAGSLLVAEAGGVVTDLLGHPLDVTNGTCLAAAPGIHAQLVTTFRGCTDD